MTRADPAAHACEDPIGHILSNPTNLVFRGTDAYVANLGRWHITQIDMSEALVG